MKQGRLIKTSRGWEVEYDECVGHSSDGERKVVPSIVTRAILLHPDSAFIEYPNHSFAGKNVEFDIINYGFAGMYAKLKIKL
jgi:hypothetical protein